MSDDKENISEIWTLPKKVAEADPWDVHCIGLIGPYERILTDSPQIVNLQDAIDRKTTRRKDATKYKAQSKKPYSVCMFRAELEPNPNSTNESASPGMQVHHPVRTSPRTSVYQNYELTS